MVDTESSKKKNRAVFLLVVTAVLWSLAGTLIKAIDWNPLAIVGARSIIAASIIYPFFIRKKKIRITKYILLGALAYSGNVICFVSATKLTTAANAIFLQYSAPIYVAILSYKLAGERVSKFDWVTTAVVFAGMTLFFIDKLSLGNLAGNTLGILSGVFFGLTAIFMRKQKDALPIESIFWGNVLTGLIGLPFMFGHSPGVSGFLLLLVLGVFQLAIPYILYSCAIKHVTALESILIPMLEPVLNPIWVFIFLAETPGKWSLIGGVAILITLIISIYSRISNKK